MKTFVFLKNTCACVLSSWPWPRALCPRLQVSLILNDQTIEVKHQFKYLGIIFQENDLYNEHVSYVHDKYIKRINLLRMSKGTDRGVSKDSLLCIGRALIRL